MNDYAHGAHGALGAGSGMSYTGGSVVPFSILSP
jgi:hypothetical protein